MRIFLTILVLIFNPIITDKGIQIGEIKTNNQTIKIMKFNFNNPAWLQGAGNAQAKEYISFVDASGNPQIHQLSAIGDVSIVSTYNGVQTTQLLTSPNEETVNIQSDPNTQVFLYGKITKLYCDSGEGTFTDFTTLDVSKSKSLTYLDCSSNQLTSLDLSANTALTYLDCSSNQLTSLDLSANTALTNLRCTVNQLTSLDLSANTALTNLDCGSNDYITTINAVAVNSDVASTIAGVITYATSVDGTVTLRQGDEFNQTIIDAAMDKGWDVQYYQ